MPELVYSAHRGLTSSSFSFTSEPRFLSRRLLAKTGRHRVHFEKLQVGSIFLDMPKQLFHNKSKHDSGVTFRSTAYTTHLAPIERPRSEASSGFGGRLHSIKRDEHKSHAWLLLLIGRAGAGYVDGLHAPELLAFFLLQRKRVRRNKKTGKSQRVDTPPSTHTHKSTPAPRQSTVLVHHTRCGGLLLHSVGKLKILGSGIYAF